MFVANAILELVADEIVLQLLSNELAKADYRNRGWILDGYPRTETQAHDLDVLLAKIRQQIDFVFYIKVDKQAIVDRVKDRWVHLASGRTYNLQYKPPKVPGLDDVTGEPLVQREDDKPATVLARLTEYEERTAPLIELYKKRGILHIIDSPTSDVGYTAMKQFLEKQTK